MNRFLELNTKEHDYNFNTYIAVISFIPEYGSQQLHTWYGQPYWVCPCTCKMAIVLEKNFHKIQFLTFVLLVGTFGVWVK